MTRRSRCRAGAARAALRLAALRLAGLGLAACVLVSVMAATTHRHDASAPAQGSTQCAICHVAQQPSLLAIPDPGPLVLRALADMPSVDRHRPVYSRPSPHPYQSRAPPP